MSILTGTRQGSYKSVPFLVSSVSTSEGVNRANYLYINTGRRVSKPLGEYPPDFTVKCFTHGKEFDEYKRKRDSLRRVLKETTVGPLVHPFMGNFTVCAGKYTIDEKFSEAGKCYFSIPFLVCEADGDNPVTPADREANSSGIRELSVTANRALQTASAAAYVNTTPFNQESSKSLFESVGDSLNKTMGPLADTIQKANEYAAEALDIKEQASFYANNPSVGYAKISDSIFGIDGLTEDTITKFKACKKLFGWGDTGTDYSIKNTSPFRIDPNPLTNEDAERKTNAQVLGIFMQGANTFEAFAQAGNTEYATVSEVNEVTATLTDQFNAMKDLMTENPDAQVYNFDIVQPDYNDTYEAMKNLMSETFQFLEQQRLTAPREEIITINPTPASVLSYNRYGDSTRAEEIMALNGLTDNMVLSGDIKVLSV